MGRVLEVDRPGAAELSALPAGVVLDGGACSAAVLPVRTGSER